MNTRELLGKVIAVDMPEDNPEIGIVPAEIHDIYVIGDRDICACIWIDVPEPFILIRNIQTNEWITSNGNKAIVTWE